MFVLETALLEWISEYAVQTYTTADSAVWYLNHGQIALDSGWPLTWRTWKKSGNLKVVRDK